MTNRRESGLQQAKTPVPFAVTYLLAELEAMRLPEPVLEHYFAKPRRWRWDLAWPQEDVMLALEIQGATFANGKHTRGQGYENDCEKLNEGQLRGWKILWCTTAMVEDGRAAEYVRRALEAAGERVKQL